MSLSFSLITTLFCGEDENLHYFLKNDKVKVVLKNSLEQDLYVNTLNVERFDTQNSKIAQESFNFVDTVSINNAIEVDFTLTKTLLLTTSYNYNINDYQIEEKNSDITLSKNFNKSYIALKYQNAKSSDMLNETNYIDSDIYSVIFNHTPNSDTFNKRLKVKLDWVKNKSKYKIDDSTVLRAKYSDGKLRFELNIQFATD